MPAVLRARADAEGAAVATNPAWTAVFSGFEVQIDDNARGDVTKDYYGRRPEPDGLWKNRTGAIYKIPAGDLIIRPVATTHASSNSRQGRLAVLMSGCTKLIKSCTIDALEPPTESPGSMAQEQISSWLDAAASATLELFPSPGVGQDVRIEGEDVIGASLVVDDHPVHMELFRPTEPRRERASEPVGAERQQPSSTGGLGPDSGGRRKNWLRRIFS